MNTFFAVLTVLTINGTDATFVIDYGLSADDCATVQADWQTNDSAVTVTCEKES